MPASLLCRKPTHLLNKGRRRARRPDREAHHCTLVLGDKGAGADRHGDVGSGKSQDSGLLNEAKEQS